MSMENDKLLEAARQIQGYCARHIIGDPCPFAPDCTCAGAEWCVLVGKSSPETWNIPGMRRWTDADVQLAKALVPFGVTGVRRYMSTRLATGVDDGGATCCHVPETAFASLKSGETVRLADVIKGAEQT